MLCEQYLNVGTSSVTRLQGGKKTPNTPCDTLDVPDESQKISFNSVSKSLLWFKFTYIERGREGGWMTNGACVHVCLLNLTSRLFFISILNTEYGHKYYSHVFFFLYVMMRFVNIQVIPDLWETSLLIFSPRIYKCFLKACLWSENPSERILRISLMPVMPMWCRCDADVMQPWAVV